jgi:NAD(P)-dependent dehydrogenase (short-subunit alcohol dehydrogenase family)
MNADPRGYLAELFGCAGKRVIVTGAAEGLGRAMATGFARAGARVVVADLNADGLAATAGELGSITDVASCRTDVTSADDVAALFALAADRFGGVDVLVNNAFRFDAFQSFEEVDLAIWRKIMDTNLFGSLQMTRAALPHMRARGGGSVVMVASMVARQPQPVQGGYAISKGALLTATRVLAFELGPSNVRVNAVVPGWMAGPSVDIYIDMTSTGRGVPAQVVVDELNARVPLGRIPSDEDVAGSIVYLASDLSRAMTGQALDTNGGEIFA